MVVTVPERTRASYEFSIPPDGLVAFHGRVLEFARSHGLDHVSGSPGVGFQYFGDNGLGVRITVSRDFGADGNWHRAVGAMFCSDLCALQADWHALADDFREFLDRESRSTVIELPLIDEERQAHAALPSESRESAPRNTIVVLWRSPNEFCKQLEVPQPYGTTKFCAKASVDRRRLESLTIEFGGQVYEAPLAAREEAVDPRLDLLYVSYETFSTESYRSYVRARLEFGEILDAPKGGAVTERQSSQTLVYSVWDGGKRSGYSIDKTRPLGSR